MIILLIRADLGGFSKDKPSLQDNIKHIYMYLPHIIIGIYT